MGWEAGVPSSKKILQDMTQIPNYSILKRLQDRGALVHGFLHLDAMSIVQQNIDISVLRWERNDPITAVLEQDIEDDMEIEEI
eukprot:12690109-Ditylum_brightwellii.AAC.1